MRNTVSHIIVVDGSEQSREGSHCKWRVQGNINEQCSRPRICYSCANTAWLALTLQENLNHACGTEQRVCPAVYLRSARLYKTKDTQCVEDVPEAEKVLQLVDLIRRYQNLPDIGWLTA
jgi:hypothetical protein